METREEAAVIPPALASLVEDLFAALEREAGWDLTAPRSTVEIVRERLGEYRIYGRGRLLVATPKARE